MALKAAVNGAFVVQLVFIQLIELYRKQMQAKVAGQLLLDPLFDLFGNDSNLLCK